MPVAIRGADLAEVARRLPASCRLVVYSDDIAATSRRFLETELGRAIAGPRFAPLRDELANAGVATLLHPRPACGLDWSDLAVVAEPGLLAVVPLPDVPAGWVLLGFPDKVTKEIPDVLRQVVEFHQDSGWVVREERQGDWRTYVFRSSVADGKRGGESSESSRAVFWGPEFYGFVSDLRLVEVLRTLPSSESLETSGRWREVVSEWLSRESSASGLGDVFYFLRPFGLARALQGESARSERDKNPLDDLARAERLGLATVDAASGILRWAPAGRADIELTSRVQVPTPLRGVLQMCDFRPGVSLSWPAWLDASAKEVQRWQWDFPAAMRGWGALFDEMTEPGPDGVGLFDDLLTGLREDPTGPRVDLAGDLFPVLGPTMLGVRDVGKNAGGEVSYSSNSRWLLVAECRDVPKARRLLHEFYRSDRQVTHRKQGQYDLWTVPPGDSLFVVGETEEFPTLRALAVGEQQLLFSTDPALLLAGISDVPAGEPLSDDASWKPLRSWVDERMSDQTAWLGIRRDNVQWEAAYEEARAMGDDESSGWEVAVWSWLLFGEATREQKATLQSAPPYSAWKHTFQGQAAVLQLEPGYWQLEWSVISEPTLADSSP